MALFVLVPLRNGAVHDIRQKLFGKLLTLPLSYFSKERKGDILAKMTSDVQEIEYGIISMLDVAFKEPMTILVFLGVMVYINVQPHWDPLRDDPRFQDLLRRMNFPD